ncbi:hypothetical protein AB1484_05960 [Parafrankia sp. FMc6]|uniref:hypothetical protein n=1 Tax=Parafrankia soli TaxID=2599596 RepID=UPI0034D5C60C
MDEKRQERLGVASAGAVVALALGGVFVLGAVLSPDDDAAPVRSEPSRVASAEAYGARASGAATWSAPTFTPAMSTARQAAIADGIAEPTASDISRYSALLAGGVEACNEPAAQVLREVEAAQRLLLATGISESRATILGQLRGMGEFDMDCLTILATYVTLRNG